MKHLILAALLLVTGMAPALADDVSLSDADNGSTVDVTRGSTVTLAVPTSGGIPYAWKLSGDGSPQLSLVGQQDQPATPGLAGGAATILFTLTAEEAGTATLIAELLPFNGGNAAKTVSITVNVTDPQ
jgi:predicted secreted protein